ncbi:unnamed protein product [Miscanthus lutarioriparius]|uniref:Serine-threonine/tyrosine-protein kinase catalytic domain-containing protein n=1 Tax=Miscanthus lutarioriparius TaxID=422564 RepID=A0A811Q858_9POAL|nr:unnamed protein product [Miscanthus lutarioriparius]
MLARRRRFAAPPRSRRWSPGDTRIGRWYAGGMLCDDDERLGASRTRGVAADGVPAARVHESADVVACIKEANVVGMGATGVVYRAELLRAVIAVKKLWPPAPFDGDDAASASEVTSDVLKEVALWAARSPEHRRLLEYGYTLKVDQKSNIYSYGVVLMELITGRRAVEAEFGEGQDIVGWVRDKIRSNTVEEHLDPHVGGGLARVRRGDACWAPWDRPSMRDVITMLGEAKPRRKSGSSGTASGKDKDSAAAIAPAVVVDKDRPVFSTTPDSGYA